MGRLSALLLMLHCIALSKRVALARDCEYFYSEQPPQPLGCNPYAASELRLECTIHGPASADFELAWFRLALSDSSSDVSSPQHRADGAELIRSEDDASILTQVREQGTKKSIRSQLRVQLQRNTAVSVYWCSVTTADGSSVALQTVPSEAFVLRAAEDYDHLPGCGKRAQSSLREKCALSALNITPPRTISMSIWQPPSLSNRLFGRTVSVLAGSIHPSHPSSSIWQPLSQSSQLLSPTMSGSPPLEEGRAALSSIAFPILACLAGAFSTLCVVFCVYLQCCRREKNTAIRKRFAAAAANHTYTLPNGMSCHCECRQGPGSTPPPALPSSSSSTLPLSKLSDSQDFSILSNDQYVEMTTSLDWEKGTSRQGGASSSCPTLNKTGPMSEHAGKGNQGFSTLPPCLEPEYATIQSPYVPYLIPVKSGMGTRLCQDSLGSYDDIYVVLHHNHDHPRPSNHPPALPPPNDHHYEPIIDTRVNPERVVPTDCGLPEEPIPKPIVTGDSAQQLPHAGEAEHTILEKLDSVESVQRSVEET